MKNTGIYIHVPFCKGKCGYCDFNSYAGLEDCIFPYFSALNKEITMASKETDSVIDTIYFGGGTPSFVDPSLIQKTLDTIFSHYNVSENAEISMECNPKTIDLSGLSLLKSSGVNRLSIGLQSTDDALLRTLGRIHNSQDFEDCLNNARRADFDNISLDLMYGLPDQTISHWQKTLEDAICFDVQHISCYCLKIEENTPFANLGLSLPDDDTVADMYDLCVLHLKNHGYERYEISNFAKSKMYSRHNLKYWRCEDFRGFGAGAYSCINNTRFSNERSVHEYIKKIDESGCAVIETIRTSAADRMSEFIFLGLRCADGISLPEFHKKFNCSIFDIYQDVINKYINAGFLICDKFSLRFSDKGFFVSNFILADFV